MKANELRIGNFVKGEGYPILVIIELFTSTECEGKYKIIALQDSIDDNRDKIIGLITEIEPIELTEDWLVRFGFKLKDVGESPTGKRWRVAKKDGFVINNANDFWVFTSVYFTNHRAIEFVHDLQNLYFCLRKKELIK